MFWRFGFHTQSAIDALLDRDEFTLEELMDEEELLQECKGQNRKLFDFLCTAGVLQALLGYITDEPNPELSEETKYKYPAIACEVLCSEIQVIYDTLFLNEDLLQEFWKFLEKPAPLNPLQGSFFTRVFTMLLQRKVPQTLAFIKKQEKPVETMLQHIGLSAMTDMVVRIAASEEVKEGEGTIQWLHDNGLVESLTSKINADQPPEVSSNAAQLLIDVINTAQLYATNKLLLVEKLKSKPIIDSILEGILKPESPNFTAAVYHGFSIFIEIVQRYVMSLGEPPVIEINEMLEALVPKLPEIHSIMEKPYVAPGELANTSFPESKPLGLLRLRIIELFSALLHTNSKEVFDATVKLQIIPFYVNLFFTYPSHNFLHTLIQDMIVTTLATPASISGELTAVLIKDSHLIEHIVESTKQNESEVVGERGTHRGYMGHLTLIAQELVKFSETPDLDKDLLAPFQTPAWEEYTHVLEATKERDSKPLGGHRPVATTDLDSSGGLPITSNDELTSSYDQDQYARFLTHQITGNMPDMKFGDEDDDFGGDTQDFETSAAAFNPFDAQQQHNDEEDQQQQAGFANFANFDQ